MLLVSEGENEDDRTPNLRRCEKIGWAKALIDAIDSPNVLTWNSVRQTTRGPDTRLNIALKDFSHLVVLADRSEYFLLITSFPVDQDHRRRKLQKQFEASKKSGDAF